MPLQHAAVSQEVFTGLLLCDRCNSRVPRNLIVTKIRPLLSRLQQHTIPGGAIYVPVYVNDTPRVQCTACMGHSGESLTWGKFL